MEWNKENIQVILDVYNKKITKERAASILNVNKITVKRKVAAYEKEGLSCFIHKTKGKVSPLKINIDAILKIIDKKDLRGCNFSYLSFLLNKFYNIKISPTCLRAGLYERSILSVRTTKKTRKRINKKLKAKLEASTKKDPLTVDELVTLKSLEIEEYTGKYTHVTKPKSKRFGERIEMDASSHTYLDGHGKLTLHVAIDDASGHLVGLHLEEQETLHGYYTITKQMLSKYGIPLAIRTDKRTVFTYNKVGEGKMENDTMTQFAYAINKLGANLHCNSDPDFKPKVERSNQTIQGQILFDLRLSGIKTIEEANKHLQEVYMPEFNSKYGYDHDIVNGRKVKIESAFIECTEEQIDKSLVCLFERQVNKGATISLDSTYYALFDSSNKQVVLNYKTKLTIVKMLDSRLLAVNAATNKTYALVAVPNRNLHTPELDEEPRLIKQKVSIIESGSWSASKIRQFINTDKVMRALRKTAYTKTA